jgi:hypothetical protein
MQTKSRVPSLATSKWAIDVLDPSELFLETLDGNAASERVAANAGYVFTQYSSEDYVRPASRGTAETLRVKKWVLRLSGLGSLSTQSECSNLEQDSTGDAN